MNPLWSVLSSDPFGWSLEKEKSVSLTPTDKKETKKKQNKKKNDAVHFFLPHLNIDIDRLAHALFLFLLCCRACFLFFLFRRLSISPELLR
jgi:hypothetical protein